MMFTNYYIIYNNEEDKLNGLLMPPIHPSWVKVPMKLEDYDVCPDIYFDSKNNIHMFRNYGTHIEYVVYDCKHYDYYEWAKWFYKLLTPQQKSITRIRTLGIILSNY